MIVLFHCMLNSCVTVN